MKKEILQLSEELIQIPSITGDNIACKRALEVLNKYLGEKLHLRVFKDNGVYSYLWGDKNTLMTPKLLLSGHVDVVGVDEDETLFKPVIRNGKLYGRGSGDMKGPDAAMVVAYKKWVEEAGARGVGLLITSDEEEGGFNGTRHVVEQGLSPQIVFIPDGNIDFNIVESQKAPHHFVIEAKGPGGHASESFAVENPLNKLVAVYSEMREKYALASQNDNWKSTFEMTVINTPNKSKNKISNSATAAFSWRWPLEQITFERGRADMIAVCKKNGCDIIEEEGGGEGCLTDKNAEFVKVWQTTIEEVIGRNTKFVNMHGATDGRHFYNGKNGGSKNVLVTSVKTDKHHGTDEWVDIESLSQLAEALLIYKNKLTNNV